MRATAVIGTRPPWCAFSCPWLIHMRDLTHSKLTHIAVIDSSNEGQLCSWDTPAMICVAMTHLYVWLWRDSVIPSWFMHFIRANAVSVTRPPSMCGYGSFVCVTVICLSYIAWSTRLMSDNAVFMTVSPWYVFCFAWLVRIVTTATQLYSNWGQLVHLGRAHGSACYV